MSIGSHGLEVGQDYELKIGSSFLSGKAKEAYHLMRYDFKPASIDTNRPALFEVGENKQCTVTIPNVQDCGTSTTTYKGGKKSCTKECVLIIDKQTGQITLERITSTIPLKKCRADKPTVPKPHSEMENTETTHHNTTQHNTTMEKAMNMNVKKMLKGRDKAPPKDNKSEKKGAAAGKGTKDTSQTNAKSSKTVHPPNPSATASSTLNNPLNNPSTSAPASSVHNSSGNTAANSSVHSSTVNNNGFAKTNPPPPRTRLMSSSDMSVSSASSDSSDSDSSDEGGDALKAQLAPISTGNVSNKPMNLPKSVNPPPKMERSPKAMNLPKYVNPPPKMERSPKAMNLPKSVNPPPKMERSPKPMNLPKSVNPPPKMERSPAKPVQSSAPLAKEATVKGKEKAFLSTLQSDLQLSDSCDSDSD